MAIVAYILGVLIAVTSVAALGLKLEKMSRPELVARAGVEQNQTTVGAAPAAVPTDATARRRQRVDSPRKRR